MIAHESLHAALVAALEPYFAGATLGPGLADPTVGPVISGFQAERISGFVDPALEAGARLAARAPAVEGLRGYFVPPTLFDEVGQATELFAEEVFGPVLAVTAVGSDEEALAAARNSRYGLSGAVWC